MFLITYQIRYYMTIDNMETSEPMLVNTILNIIGVNSLRLGGLHIITWSIQFRKSIDHSAS